MIKPVKTPDVPLSELTASTSAVADMLNLSSRRVEQLVAKRVLPQLGRGKFNVLQTVKAYCLYLQQVSQGGGTVDAEVYKSRLLKATVLEAEEKAKLREIARREKEGELIERAEIASQWAARCVELKAALLAIPARVGFRFQDPATRAAVEEETEAAIYEILKSYSRGDFGDSGDMDEGGASGA